MSDPFYFDRSRLKPLADRLAPAFAAAQPFPHVVIDDFLPPEVITALVDCFPEATGDWTKFNTRFEVKFAQRDEEAMPKPVRHVIQQFNSQPFLEFLERLTGIKGLLPDPSLAGGGMHQIAPGGLLKVHADFNEHPHLHVDRRLNVLLYLNADWEESYGGDLELWNRNMTAMGARIAPIANRLVVFATTQTSFHGHPDPLTCPPGRYRRSLAWYYYTAPRPLFRSRHSTLFQARPDEPEIAKVLRAGRHPVRTIALRLTPVGFKERYEAARRASKR
jgi:hypothetical protein